MLKNRNCVFTAWQIAESKVLRENFTKAHGLSASPCVRRTEVLICSAQLPTTVSNDHSLFYVANMLQTSKMLQSVTFIKQQNMSLLQLTQVKLHIHLS